MISRACFALMFASLVSLAVAAPITQTITYQGELTENGAPKTGTIDVVVKIFDDAQAGSQFDVRTFQDVPVTDGLFSLPITLDNLIFLEGGDWWLEISVRDGAQSGSAPHTKLAPRQLITTVPYAINADTLDGSSSSAFLKTSASAFKRSEFGNELIPDYGEPETWLDNIGVTAPASGRIVFRARGACKMSADDTNEQEVSLGLGRNQIESLESRYINGALVYFPPTSAAVLSAQVPFTLEREYSVTAGQSISIFLFGGKSDGLEIARCSGSLSAEFFASGF